MSLKKFKPTTPGQRHKVALQFGEVTKSTPEKSLLSKKKKSGGRNNDGKMTMRHIGGGHKQKYRVIDFKRNKFDIPATVKGIEYDPNRTANIALLYYADGEKRYIIAPNGLKEGDKVLSGKDATPVVGNAMYLSDIPLGTMIHNIELQPGKGGSIARGAGTYAQLIAKEGDFVTLKLPSNEVRLVSKKCYATLGQVGNIDSINITLGKAGRSRWLGKKPKVRGVVKNPIDHPHGGGEGRSPIGRPKPVTPWGKPALGIKTRSQTKASSKYILRSRR